MQCQQCLAFIKIVAAILQFLKADVSLNLIQIWQLSFKSIQTGLDLRLSRGCRALVLMTKILDIYFNIKTSKVFQIMLF